MITALSRGLAAAFLGLTWLPAAAAQTCGGDAPVQVQVLGAGGPELRDPRAAGGHLVWIDGKPRVLVDIGGGAARRFGEAGATVTDLDVILLTRLHADRTTDLPLLVQASLLEKRTRPLPLYGPDGNRFMPSTVAFVRTLFDGTRGAWRHLGDVLNPLARGSYKLQPQDVHPAPGRLKPGAKPADETMPAFASARLRASAVPVSHGNAPALAWRVSAGGKNMVFAGDAGGQAARLAQGADLLLAHDPQGTATGKLAQQAQVRQLVLSPPARAASGTEEETLTAIRRHYAGPVRFADDLDCLTP